MARKGEENEDKDARDEGRRGGKGGRDCQTANSRLHSLFQRIQYSVVSVSQAAFSLRGIEDTFHSQNDGYTRRQQEHPSLAAATAVGEAN